MLKVARDKMAARRDRVAAVLGDDVDRTADMLARVLGDVHTAERPAQRRAEIRQAAESLHRLIRRDIPELIAAAEPCRRPHVTGAYGPPCTDPDCEGIEP